MLEENSLDASYWESRYAAGHTGWDAGGITSPLKAYIDQLADKSLTILIPGAGNAYEAEYLHKSGFKQVFVLDIALSPLRNLKNRFPNFPQANLLHGDFFEHKGQYDLILEQTFFCALDPKLRPSYARKMHNLLKPSGRLVGLLFDAKLNEDHPPFGGNREEYFAYFKPHFQLKKLETAYNSIKPREGRELWMHLVKSI